MQPMAVTSPLKCRVANIEYKLLNIDVMKAFTIISLVFAILFVVLMVASVLFCSVLMIVGSIGCMFVSMLAMAKACR